MLPRLLRAPLFALLLLALLPLVGRAGTPVLALDLAAPYNTYMRTFIDQVEIVDFYTGTVVAGVVPNAGFETAGALAAGSYVTAPANASWTFNAQSGIAANSSLLKNPAAPDGTRAGFLMAGSTVTGRISQALPNLPTGRYRVRLQLAQYLAPPGGGTQSVRLLMDGLVLNVFTPTPGSGYSTSLSADFAVANDVLRLEGLGSAGSPGADVLTFLDQVEIVSVTTGAVVAGALGNAGFETSGALASGSYGYQPGGATWVFDAQAGLAANGSPLGNPSAPEGTQVAVLHGSGSSQPGLEQPLLGLLGTYQVRVRAAQGSAAPADQPVRVLLNTRVLATFMPVAGSFQTYLSAPFTIGPPSITGFSPAGAAVGGSVTVTGDFLDGATALTLNGVPMPLSSLTANTGSSLTFTVPAGATTGLIGVATPNGMDLSSGVLTMAPVITGFSPVVGAAGSIVSVTGLNLAGGLPTVNGTAVPGGSYNSATRCTFTVPAGATSGPVGVTTAGGTAVSSQSFVIGPVVSSLAPAQGPAGTSVTVTGLNLAGATGLTLNGAAVPVGNISANTATSLTFVVPAGATSGPVAVRTAGTQGLASTQPFAVTTGTTLTFAPALGRVGTVVTVTGTGLAAATAATVNGTPGTILSATATSLTFVVGPGTTTGRVAVLTPTGTASSTGNFSMIFGLPDCYEEVDTVTTAANGGYTALGKGSQVFGSAVTADGRCDDCSEKIDLGFGFQFYGNTYTQCFINSNGCVSFYSTTPGVPTCSGTGILTWIGSAMPTTYGPVIAPYWADVDTRNAKSGRIWYKLYADRLVVLWSRVGYFLNSSTAGVDKKNTFMLIIRRNTVTPAPGTDVTFVYGDQQWLSGAASTGYPQVGFDSGDGVHSFNIQGTLSAQTATVYSNTCQNFLVSALQTRLYVSNPMLLSPNPVGVGQEVTLLGPTLTGTTGVVLNNADATPSLTPGAAGSARARVPATATLAGISSTEGPFGVANSTALNVLPEPGQALAFDGTDDYVSVPHAAALNLPTALTVEAWMRTTSGTEQYLVTKGEDSWLLAVNGNGGAAGRASFYLNGPSAAGGWLYGTSVLNDGHWHHLAGTYDGAALKLYVDGALEASRPATGAVATGTSPLLLGSQPGKPYLNGSLDEVRLWRTARSAAELVAGLYQAPAQPAPDLVAYFNFDRGTPNNQNQAHRVFHEVVNGWVATLNNFALAVTVNYPESYALVLPRAPVVSALTPTRATLQWQQPDRGSVTGYVLDVATTASFTAPTTYTLTDRTTQQALSGLTANTRYYYRVRAERRALTGQGASASGSFTTLAVPTCPVGLSSFSPATGAAGSTIVSITGTGFTALTVTGVTFGGVAAATFAITSATTITATVPAGAASGSIGLVGPCGTTPSDAAFTVSSSATLAAVSDAELPGQTVTVTGTGFDAASVVRFDSQRSPLVTYVSPTQLRAVVPVPLPGASYEGVSLTATTPAGPTPAVGTRILAVANARNFGLSTPATPVNFPAADAWHYLLHNGQVVLAYNSPGRNLGTVGASYVQADPTQAVRRDAHGQYYLGRNWRLTSSTGVFPGSSVQVRFCLLTTEYEQLRAADPAHVTSLASLRLTQYSGPNEDCDLTNNAGGTSRLLTPTATYGPDGSGFIVVEATVPDHFSEFYLSGNIASPLPVELTAFTATAAGPAAVRLAWATASELNSAWFDVERSLDGVAFAPIGTVAAAGSSSSARRYELLDARLPAGAARLYYRLKQVDADGTSGYSPVRAVALTGAGAGMSLYPNPAPGGAATLVGAMPGAAVTVFDVLGRPVATATADAAGTAALRLPAGLSAGVYVVRAGSQALRLVVE